jgi:hypothetical protein
MDARSQRRLSHAAMVRPGSAQHRPPLVFSGRERSPAVCSGQPRSLEGSRWAGRTALTWGRRAGRNCMACKRSGVQIPSASPGTTHRQDARSGSSVSRLSANHATWPRYHYERCPIRASSGRSHERDSASEEEAGSWSWVGSSSAPGRGGWQRPLGGRGRGRGAGPSLRSATATTTRTAWPTRPTWISTALR